MFSNPASDRRYVSRVRAGGLTVLVGTHHTRWRRRGGQSTWECLLLHPASILNLEAKNSWEDEKNALCGNHLIQQNS